MGIETAIGFAILAELSIMASATTAAIIGSVVIAATLTAVNIGINMLLAPKSPGQSTAPPPEAGHIALRQSITSRYFGYGRTRLINGYALYEGKDGVSYDVLPICQGPICGIVKYLLHEDIVTLNGGVFVDNVVEVDGATSVNNDGRYGAAGGATVKIETRLGLPTETAFSDITAIFPTEWNATHRGDGIASLALICNGVPLDQLQKVYPNQKPEPSVIADLLPLWDFRDSGQNATDATTWVDYAAYDAGTTYAAGDRRVYGGVVYKSAVSSNAGNTPGIKASYGKWVSVFSNPVLQIVNYVTNGDYGLGLDRALLIDPVITALTTEANLCDEIVATADGVGEPRYRSDGWSTYSTDPADVLAPILAACDGWMIVDGDGALSLKVGKYSAPTVTLEDKHILGCSVQYGVSDKDVINELALTFCDPANNYKTEPGQAWRNESDISSRGKVRSQPFDLSWVQSHAQARRLAKRAMARLSAPLRGKLICTLYGLAAVDQRYLTVNYTGSPNMAGIVVEVQKVETDFLAARVVFDWIKVDPDTIDTWTPATEEGTPPPNPDEIGGGSIPVPTGLEGAIVGDGIVTAFRFDLSIDDPERADLGYVFQYRLEDDGTGNPGPWTQQIFSASGVIIDSGSVYATIWPTVGDRFELQAAFQSSGGVIGTYSDSIFLDSSDFMLDRSRAKDSGYQMMGWI